MSEADKLFKELGYVKVLDDTEYLNELFDAEMFLKYINDTYHYKGDYIEFFKDRTFAVYHFDETERNRVSFVTMQELKAINMKCKELGWIEQ